MKRILHYFLTISILSWSVFTANAQEEKEDGFKIGGAVRFNMISTNYESDPTALNTAATWDTWRLNVDGSKGGLDLSFEYRFYPTFGTHFIHHGYVGYNLSESHYLKLGVFQKPFGAGKFASHSWWFQGPYYVGLEDDYDIGVGYDFTISDKAKLQVAYFRQAEPEGPVFGGDVTFGNGGAGRYSYDITTGNVYTAGGDTYHESIRELNTGNMRFTFDATDNIELGISAQAGGIYNDYLQSAELATAFAGHVIADVSGFNLKAEYVYYDYNAKGVQVDGAGNETTYDLETVQMGAYGFNYPVAAEAHMYVAGLAYTIPVDFGPIKSIQPYVDFTMIDKVNPDFVDTYHLIPGALISAGPIYCYVDFAMGKNQPWLTDNFGVGLGQGRTYSNNPANEGLYYYTEDASKAGEPVPLKEMPWNTRFNINLGYYF
jgi:hypothetical protein